MYFFPFKIIADEIDYDNDYDNDNEYNEAAFVLRSGGITDVGRLESKCQGTLAIHHLPDLREKVYTVAELLLMFTSLMLIELFKFPI